MIFVSRRQGSFVAPGARVYSLALGPSVALLQVVTHKQHRPVRLGWQEPAAGAAFGAGGAASLAAVLSASSASRCFCISCCMAASWRRISALRSGAGGGLGGRRVLGRIGHRFRDPGRLDDALHRGRDHLLAEGREHPEAPTGEHRQEQRRGAAPRRPARRRTTPGLRSRDSYRWPSSWRPPGKGMGGRRPLRAVLAIVGTGNRAQAFPTRDGDQLPPPRRRRRAAPGPGTAASRITTLRCCRALRSCGPLTPIARTSGTDANSVTSGIEEIAFFCRRRPSGAASRPGRAAAPASSHSPRDTAHGLVRVRQRPGGLRHGPARRTLAADSASAPPAPATSPHSCRRYNRSAASW